MGRASVLERAEALFLDATADAVRSNAPLVPATSGGNAYTAGTCDGKRSGVLESGGSTICARTQGGTEPALVTIGTASLRTSVRPGARSERDHAMDLDARRLGNALDNHDPSLLALAGRDGVELHPRRIHSSPPLACHRDHAHPDHPRTAPGLSDIRTGPRGPNRVVLPRFPRCPGVAS